MMMDRDPAGIERLIALDGRHVWVSIARSAEGDGVVLTREGTLRLSVPSEDLRAPDPGYAFVVARVFDDVGCPVAVLLSTAALNDWTGVLRYEPRLTFWCDIDDREPLVQLPDASAIAAESCARGIVAELEASLGFTFIVDPDPDFKASARSLYPNLRRDRETMFRIPSNTHIGANARSASLHWNETFVSATFFAPYASSKPEILVEILCSRAGDTYTYTEIEMRRLGSDLRRFFHGSLDHLLPRGRSHERTREVR